MNVKGIDICIHCGADLDLDDPMALDTGYCSSECFEADDPQAEDFDYEAEVERQEDEIERVNEVFEKDYGFDHPWELER